GQLIAGVMVQVDAVPGQLHRIASGHHIDQKASAGEAVEGGGHARRRRGGDEAGTDRDQKAHALGDGQQGSAHHPRILAGSPRGQKRTGVSQVIHRLGELFQVRMVDGAPSPRDAQVTPVAVGGNKPEDIHRFSFLSFEVFSPSNQTARFTRMFSGIRPASKKASAICCCSFTMDSSIGTSPYFERVMAFSTVFTSIPICLERSRAVSSGCSLNQSVVCFNSSRNARMMSSCSSTQVREARMNSRLVV